MFYKTVKTSRIVLLVFLLAINFFACRRGLPKDVYEWHPLLKQTKGQLEGFVQNLSIGSIKGVDHYHPLDPKKDYITLGNIEDLSAFVERQEDAAAWAFAWYNVPDHQSQGFVYAALAAPETSIVVDKQKEYTGYPNKLHLGSPMVLITFRVLPVPRLSGSAPSPDCRVFAVRGSADVPGGSILSGLTAYMAEGQLDYLVLVTTKKNLYVEIALPVFDLFEENKKPGWLPEFNCKPLSWDKPPLSVLRAAHDEIGLFDLQKMK